MHVDMFDGHTLLAFLAVPPESFHLFRVRPGKLGSKIQILFAAVLEGAFIYGLCEKAHAVDFFVKFPEFSRGDLPRKKGLGVSRALFERQTAVYRTGLSLGAGVPSQAPLFHPDMSIRSELRI
ncbi:hypothetical protein, partial [Desulfococcus sp.]|uniref:hypothetical protein n=1 Tax=Desulfococcus sp. TaxID=2025834 RepID=UPI003593E727